MIRINLLPPEFRVKERTPLPMLLGILGGVVLCVLVLLVFLYFHMVWLPKVNADLKEANLERTMNQRKVKEFNELVKQQNKYKKLDEVVKEVEFGKDYWAVYMKDLVTILNEAEKENELLKAWISDLKFQVGGEARRGQKPSGGSISFKGDIAGSDFGLYSDFLGEVMKRKEGRVLATRIQAVQVPKLSVKDHSGYTPDKSVNFPFLITLKAKEKPKAKPKPKAPAKPAQAKGQ